ncbi:MAG: DUF502 domain-containing protein [Rhodocyclaceae bacterium]|nr:DUF502 domain-containing protein [Rhodocyclaceae bacterium]
MNSLGKIFATGLLAVVPIVATLYLLAWIFTTAESFFGQALFGLVPPELRFPGMGVALGVVAIFGVGLLMRAWVFRALFHRIEHAVLSIPLVKSIYSAIRDFFGMIASDEQDDTLKVVSVTWPGTSMRLIGFVTRSDFTGLPAGVGGTDEVAVYFPMSYQIGGYTLFVPTAQITPVEMTREAAMRFVLTAGVNADDTPRPPA